VIEADLADGLGAGGVDGCQGHDQPLGRGDGDLLDRGDLVVGHGQHLPVEVAADAKLEFMVSGLDGAPGRS
jgi:hypothetical protein